MAAGRSLAAVKDDVAPGPAAPPRRPSASAFLPLTARCAGNAAVSRWLAVQRHQGDAIVQGDGALKAVFDTYDADVTRTVGNDSALIRQLRLYLKAGASGEEDERWRGLWTINQALAGASITLLTCLGRNNADNQFVSTAELRTIVAFVTGHPAVAVMVIGGRGRPGAGASLLAAATAADQATIQDLADLVQQQGGVLANRNLMNPAVRPLLMDVRARGLGPGATRPTLAWGAGAESDADRNKEVHVLKHALRLGDPDNPDPLEPYKWSKLLNARVTRGFVTMHDPTGTVPTYFGPQATDVLQKGDADDFYNTHLPTRPALKAAVEADIGPRYLDRVVTAAAQMASPTVTAEGGRVFLSGQHGDIYVAARWSDSDHAFSISSGYLRAGRAAANAARFKVWSLA